MRAEAFRSTAPDRFAPARSWTPRRSSAWLAERLPELARAGGGVPAVEVEQFGRGYSNLTYLVRIGGRELVLRRPPVGSRVATAHDMGREYRILAALSAGDPPAFGLAPRPLAYCDDPAVLGAPFYVMERVRGVILRADPPPGIDLGPDNARRLSEAFADHLARLHAVDVAAAGLGGLGRPGYVERQVRGWSERWRAAATDEVPEMDKVAAWLAGRLPTVVESAPATLALIHNDYKYDNLVLDPADPARVVALLDWEMATVGDPLLDLGTALGYWVEAGDPEPLQRFRFGPTHLPGSLTRREVAERYAAASGRPRGRPPVRLRLRPVQDRRHRPADLLPLPPGPHPRPPLRRPPRRRPRPRPPRRRGGGERRGVDDHRPVGDDGSGGTPDDDPAGQHQKQGQQRQVEAAQRRDLQNRRRGDLVDSEVVDERHVEQGVVSWVTVKSRSSENR